MVELWAHGRSYDELKTSLESLPLEQLVRYVSEYKIAGGHWPFYVHFSMIADQSIKQDTFKYTNGQSNSY